MNFGYLNLVQTYDVPACEVSSGLLKMFTPHHVVRRHGRYANFAHHGVVSLPSANKLENSGIWILGAHSKAF